MYVAVDQPRYAKSERARYKALVMAVQARSVAPKTNGHLSRWPRIQPPYGDLMG